MCSFTVLKVIKVRNVRLKLKYPVVKSENKRRFHSTVARAVVCSPVDNEVLVWGLFITHRTHPGGLLLIHLDVQCCIKALQM